MINTQYSTPIVTKKDLYIQKTKTIAAPAVLTGAAVALVTKKAPDKLSGKIIKTVGAAALTAAAMTAITSTKEDFKAFKQTAVNAFNAVKEKFSKKDDKLTCVTNTSATEIKTEG